jgi:hypothetical protein
MRRAHDVAGGKTRLATSSKRVRDRPSLDLWPSSRNLDKIHSGFKLFKDLEPTNVKTSISLHYLRFHLCLKKL